MAIGVASALDALWRALDHGPAALDRVRLTGAGPVLPSSFAVADLAQASIAAATLAVAELWTRRTGHRPPVDVDRAHACAAFRSERYLTVDGRSPPDPWDALAGLYRTACGGWVRLHTNFPHHRAGIEALLDGADTRQAVAAALLGWSASAFEQAAADRGMLAFALRRFEAWDAHPQGQALAHRAPVTVTRIGDGAPRPLPDGSMPLAGIRVLDLSRVLAGPVAGRTLAVHGADVMRVASPHLPFVPSLVIDTGRGKRSAFVDLRTERGQSDLRRLVEGADVFVDAYRPGALAAKGFGAEALAARRPGIVVATLSAFGATGPWAGRRGFDSLVQAASGFNLAEAEAAGDEAPRALPCQALDHGAGYLLAYGIATALLRRAETGGSWHVDVSLAGVGHGLRRLGRVADGFAVSDPGRDAVAGFLETVDSGFGRLEAIAQPGIIEGVSPHSGRSSVPLGHHAPRW